MAQTTWTSRVFDIARKPSSTEQIQELRELLSKGAQIDAVDEHGQTCLHVAVLNNNIDVVNILLESNKTSLRNIINKRNRSWNTPLTYAVRTNNFELIRSLVKAGANADDIGYDAILQLIDVADDVLDKCADVNKSNYNGDTFLIYFARRGRIQVVRKLLNLNADINRVNKDGISALVAAIEGESEDIIKLLIEEEANVNPPVGKLPLVCAVENDNFEIVKSLVAYGASVNKVDSQGNSPLSTAVRTNNDKIIEWLLDNGARFSIHSVFLESIKRGNLKIIEMLIEKGAKVNFQYKNGSTPLLTAIEAKRFDVVETLLAHGADINLEGNIEGIAIFPFRRLLESDSIGVRFKKIVKTFIDNGADVNIMCDKGFSWLTKYAQLDDYQMVQYLVSKGANISTEPLVIAAKNLNFEMFDYLVNSCGDIEQVREELNEIANSNDSFAIYLEERCGELKKKRNQINDKGHEEESSQ